MNINKEFVSKCIIFLLQTFIMLMIIIYVAKINYHNGRLSMCQDLGLNYTIDKECIKVETKNMFDRISTQDLNISLDGLI